MRVDDLSQSIIPPGHHFPSRFVVAKLDHLQPVAIKNVGSWAPSLETQPQTVLYIE